MNKKWKLLKESIPKGDERVLLFNPAMHNDLDFPGLSVMTSNPEFARRNGLNQGYTHWAKIPYPLPLTKIDKNNM